MSSSSPDDLAIAFRSVGRRLREATGESSPDPTLPDHAALQALLERAARLLGTVPEPAAIADAISSTKPDHWDASVLDELRQVALDLGAVLRRIAAQSRAD